VELSLTEVLREARGSDGAGLLHSDGIDVADCPFDLLATSVRNQPARPMAALQGDHDALKARPPRAFYVPRTTLSPVRVMCQVQDRDDDTPRAPHWRR
jgi:hypothetical protein